MTQKHTHIPTTKRLTLVVAVLFMALLAMMAGRASAQSPQLFTTPGTSSWTAPAGITAITVECWGAGGSGGGATGNPSGGGGGAGGAYARSINVPVTPGSSYSLSVGTGGAGTTGAGDPGDATYFVNTSTVHAVGGAGGNLAASGSALGATASSSGSVGNDLIKKGGNGGTGATGATAGGGGSSAGTILDGNNGGVTTAGAAPTGGAAGGNGGLTTGNGGAGNPGSSPGGGGGGGRAGNNNDRSGADGGDGQVRITWICPTYSLTSTTVASPICAGSPAVVTLNGNAANLPVGTYTVTYDQTVNNVATGVQKTMTVTVAGTGAFTTNALATAGSTTITITNLTSGATGGTCSSAISTNRTATVTVITAPGHPGTITGSSALCAGTTGLTYSITAVPGATGYTWTVPTGSSITAGQGTVSITVTAGSPGQNGNITVISSNSCGSTTAFNTDINPDIATNNTGFTDGSTKTDGNITCNTTPNEKRGYIKFSLSTLPAGAVITASALSLTNNGTTTASGATNNITALLNNDPTTTAVGTLYSAISTGTSYSAAVWSTITGTFTLSLNSTANSNIQSRISSPGYLAVGLLRAGFSPYLFHGYSGGANAPELNVAYTFTRSLAITITPAVATPTASNGGTICSGLTANLTASGLAPGGTVASFTGTNGASTHLTSVSNSFTMDFWVKPANTITINAQATSGTTGLAGQRYAVMPGQGGTNAGAGVSVGTNGISVYEHGNSYLTPLLSYTYPASITTWFHVAVVYTSRTPSLYINGSLVATGLTSVFGANSYPSIGTDGLTGGANYGPYTGLLDDYRIWNGALTQTEVVNTMFGPNGTTSKTKLAQYTFDGSSVAGSVGGNPNWTTPSSFAAPNYLTYTWTGTSAPAASTAETQTTTAGLTGNQNYTVVATVAGACASAASAATTVNVTPTVGTPTTPSPAASTRCQGAGTTAYTTSATNATSYSWSVTGVGNTISGTGTTGTVTWDAGFTGSATITVTATGCGTSAPVSTTMNVTPTVGTPTTPSPAASTRCQGAGTTAYTTSATNATTYSWSVTGVGNTISGTGTTGTVTWDAGFTGSATITVTATGCGTSAPISTTMNVTPTVGTPTTPSPAASTRCQGAGTTAYTTSATNATSYSWSVTGVGNTISGTGTTGTVTWDAGFTGSATITVTSTGCGTSAPASTTMSVTPAATSFAGANDMVCAGSPAYALNGAVATNYSSLLWTNNGGDGGFDNNAAQNPIYTPGTLDIAAGTVTLTLTANGNSPCGNVPSNMTLTIEALPTVSASVDQNTCSTGNTTLAGTKGGSATGATWTTAGDGTFLPGNTPTSNVLAATYAPGANDISSGSVVLTLTSTGSVACTSVNDQMTITFDNPLLQPSVIAGAPVSVCPPQSGINLSVTNDPGADSYNWFLGPNSSGVAFNPVSTTNMQTIDITASVNSTYNIKVEAVNACGASPSRGVSIRRSTSTPQAVLGEGWACANNVKTYSVAAVGGATSYQWTASDPGVFFDGNPINTSPYVTAALSVTATFPSPYTVGTIGVASQVACFTSPVKTLTVNNAPTFPSIISGLNLVCPTQTGVAYSVVNTIGLTYTWTAPANATIFSGNTTPSVIVNYLAGFNGGQLQVTANSLCGSSVPRKLNVGVTGGSGVTARPVSITGVVTNLCGASGVILTANPNTLGATYTFTTNVAGASSLAGPANNQATFTFPTGWNYGTVSVTQQNACATVSTARVIDVKAKPANPVITGPIAVSTNQTGVVYSIPVLTPAATLISWAVPAGAIITAGQNTASITVTFGANAGSGNVIVNQNNACGNSTRVLLVTISSPRFSGTGKDVADAINFSVYPNPASSILNLSFNAATSGNSSVQLLDLSGKVVAQKLIVSNSGFNTNTIDVSTLAKGMYILNVQTPDGNLQSRIVVE